MTMTTVEYGNSLDDRLFGSLEQEDSNTYSKCAGRCMVACKACVRCRRTSTEEITLRPTLPKGESIANAPSLLETYVATVSAENVEPRYASLLTRLEELDLDPIKVKLMDAEEGEGWTREQTDRAATEYKKFMFLNIKYDGSSIVPTKVVDTVWHYHILDTRKYAEDSQEIFGHFFHHFPYFGMRGEEDAENLKSSFAETRDLFTQNFGTPQLASFDEKAESIDKAGIHCKSAACKSGGCRGCKSGTS